MIEIFVGVVCGIAIGWIGRGYALLLRAKRDGRILSRTESARAVLFGGRV